jgi:hypothetical protein
MPSNLPPGCTDADIERNAGGGLSEEELEQIELEKGDQKYQKEKDEH